MYSNAEFGSSANELDSMKSNIVSDICFQGFEVVEEQIDNIYNVLRNKNEEMQQLYEMFNDAQSEMSRINELMVQDPESSNQGTPYIKKR